MRTGRQGEQSLSVRSPHAGLPARPGMMLALATAGFAVTFWAWALLGPLAATLRQELSLTSFQQSLLVALPVVVGSLGRIPVGALTDRLGARRMFPAVALLTVVPVLSYSSVALLALLATGQLDLVPIGTLAFLGMAAALGTATGAVFALLARLVKPERVGAVTGVVGAAGGLGGFFPPLVMGLIYGALGDYTIGLLLLAATATIAAAFTATAMRRRAR